jgi:ATP-dependent RNA helicase RhlE
MLFADLRLAEPILRAISYPNATPIQAQAIPHVLAGRDVMGCAQTGTGKTAAFALPILHRLFKAPRPGGQRRVRALVLCPTRELATQTNDAFLEYGRHLDVRTSVIFGGVGERPQIDALRRGVDVLIATPGRLLDLMRQRHADLRSIETLVLDEADRMLDMGFIHDIRKIVAQVPAQRQTLMFSATMPPEIRTLAGSLLRQPAEVQIERNSSPVDAIDQSVYFVDRHNKPALLAHLFHELPMARAIVFTRTKHGADRVVRHLHGYGIRCEAIHGNKTQNARQRALGNFRDNKTPVLVATDIAARGIDVDGITHVVNYDLTHEPETYVHRIGRTARAGATGAAVAFCDPEEVPNLKAIERLIRRPIPVKNDHPKYERSKLTVSHVHHDQPRHPQRAAARPAWSPPRPAHKPHLHAGPRPAVAGKPHASRRLKHPMAGFRRRGR